METREIRGQECWLIENESVSLALTRLGGMMAPVRFTLPDGRQVEPYYVSPWQEEGLEIDEPVLVPLRGDFFCAPFGAGSTYEGVDYVSHGPAATGMWGDAEVSENPSAGGVRDAARSNDPGPSPSPRAGDNTAGVSEKAGPGSGGTPPAVELRTSMDSGAPLGSITKSITLREGHTAVYQRHTLRDVQVSLPLGHHATLAADPAAPLLISTSPVRFGMVDTDNAPVYVNEEYRSLEAGARFEQPEAVPTVWRREAQSDCTVFPAREGFVDIIQVVAEPREGEPAWVTAACPERGYLWYSLKDSKVLPSTVFWMENRGRHGAPWNGRNCCIGLEDVCAAFAGGMAASNGANPLAEAGVATVVSPDAKGQISVSYIEGVIGIPSDFGRAEAVEFGDEGIRVVGENGAHVSTNLDWRYALRR
ncbi:MAG: hypothetical protein ACLFP4_09620 [Spirochaetales bacterium]